MLFVIKSLNIMDTYISGFTIKLESGGVSLQKAQTRSSRRQAGEKSRCAAEFPVNERCPASRSATELPEEREAHY